MTHGAWCRCPVVVVVVGGGGVGWAGGRAMRAAAGDGDGGGARLLLGGRRAGGRRRGQAACPGAAMGEPRWVPGIGGSSKSELGVRAWRGRGRAGGRGVRAGDG